MYFYTYLNYALTLHVYEPSISLPSEETYFFLDQKQHRNGTIHKIIQTFSIQIKIKRLDIFDDHFKKEYSGRLMETKKIVMIIRRSKIMKKV